MNDAAFGTLIYESLDSTNAEARRLLNSGRITTLTLIRARHQTAGRGTRGRRWISPPGAGLYLSIVHPFPEETGLSVPITPLFTLAAGVACADALRELSGLSIQLKPVNDLYVEGGKLGGILTEGILEPHPRGTACKGLITGIGINVFAHEAVTEGCQADQRGNVPVSLQRCIPPHLFERWHGEALMEEISRALVPAVDARYRQLMAGDAPTIVRQYLHAKLPGVALPPEIARLLPAGLLIQCPR
jgi:biotin-[acetyl-CoA-carboxylase] ligase BirA-like protein